MTKCDKKDKKHTTNS